MALVKATVSTAIKSALQSAYNTPTEGQAELQKFADGLAEALVSILTSQMVITVAGSIPATGIVAPNGPCTGAAAASLTGVVS
jgi:hypothetical protein